MPGKLNNRRRYNNVNHQPNHKAKFRMDEAKERQEAYDKLSIEEKVAKLDTKLGAGMGAVKQRARLATQLEERNKPKPVPKQSVASTQTDKETETQKSSKELPNKKYMKGHYNENS